MEDLSKSISVYDDYRDCFRDLDEHNYNDDFVVGTIFFTRDALDVLEKYFCVCGYVLVSREFGVFPIDIRKDEIALLEGTYNSLSPTLRKELVSFNIKEKPRVIWSRFFISWQFLADRNAFVENGHFIEMCSDIISSNARMETLVKNNINLTFPLTFEELCQFAQDISLLFDTDLYCKDYVEEFNYLVDSLLNGYHLNLSNAEIETCCYQLCSIVCKMSEAE